MTPMQQPRPYTVQLDVEDLKFRCYAAMHVAGLTVRDVADYLGISVSRVQGAVHGDKYLMTVEFLVAFSAVVGCSIADLLPFVNDTLPFPYTFSVIGGGAVERIAPDPYRVTMREPETLGADGWSVAPQSEVSEV